MDPVRIGVLGCADIARRRMLPAMRDCADVELVAVASRHAATAAATAADFHCRPVTGYPALLEIPDVDAVYVPLPAALHAPWVSAALQAGKHVLAEKPLTTDLAATRRLAALAADGGLALMENVMFVHHSRHERVRALVADGAIGAPRTFQATFAVPRLPESDIRYDPALGGGALWDTGVYPVRAAVHFLGEGLRVEGAVLAGDAGGRVDTAGTALLSTPDGVTAQLAFGLDHSYRSCYEIWGSAGRIVVDRAFTPPAGHPARIVLERRTGTEEITLAPEDQVHRTLVAFALAVRTGAPLPPASLHQAALLEELRRSAADGKNPGRHPARTMLTQVDSSLT
ncbi:Gfo/Idh/MocA family protein [Streptomyces sp. NPDC101393]|uniref:Gfo/Idh/MocA family protein n=1 Tax=Streptomyces sp. NPDC101393 TaxID=3366141 RepID=UPI0037F6F10C